MYLLGIIYIAVMLLFAKIILKYKYKKYILNLLALFLLSYKVIEYTIYGLNLEITKVPLEFSTVSYFIFSSAVLFKMRGLYSIAAFIAFISGIGYLLAFSIVGDIFIAEQGLNTTLIALVNHSILFLGSMIVISQHKLDKSESKHIIKFTVIYLIYVIVLNLFFDFSKERIFIQMLLGIDFSSISVESISYLYLLYFLVLVIMYQFVMNMFFFINKQIMMKGEESYEHSI